MIILIIMIITIIIIQIILILIITIPIILPPPRDAREAKVHDRHLYIAANKCLQRLIQMMYAVF